MKIEAMVSFCGVLSMSKGEIRDYSVEPVVSDLMEAGYIREISEKTVEKTKPENDFVYRDFEEKLKKIMGTQVVIKNKNNNKGKIEIQYYSQAELERIYDMLKKINE